MSILLILVLLVNIACFIIVLIKLFQNEGALKGILGLICSLYTFIWGWMNAGRLNIRNIMIIWTIIIIIQIILNVVFGSAMAGQYATPVTP
jgi:hypothetical protein